MRNELKKYNKNFHELVINIPVAEIKEIYFKQSYDSKRTFWIDKDLESFNKKEEDLLKFMEKMDYHQRNVCIVEEINAHIHVLHDLRILMRSQGLLFINFQINDSWINGRVLEYLKTYDKTKDEYYYNKAKNLLKMVDQSTNELMSPEHIEKIEGYIKALENVGDLTDEDKEILGHLKQYTENMKLNNKFRFKS